MNVGCSGFGLSCKANKCSDTGTGDLGVLTTHEASPLVTPAQPAQGECRLKMLNTEG